MQADRRGSVEYGLVVDADGDRAADCRLALRSAGSEWRVLLENVATGERDERVGPPYGYPFEFGFPTADGVPGNAPSIYIEFLGSWQEPCTAPTGRLRWYAYTVLRENGRVTDWDFAPDDAWLQTLPRLAVEFGGRIDRTEWGRGLPLPPGP